MTSWYVDEALCVKPTDFLKQLSTHATLLLQCKTCDDDSCFAKKETVKNVLRVLQLFVNAS